MTKKWEVTVNGTNNVIEYKAGFGAKILVNGQAYNCLLYTSPSPRD